MESCFICRKHNGQEDSPPGGYIYQDEHWMICHAPVRIGPLGTLFLESRRHLLDYSEMTSEESASLGDVLKQAYHALRTNMAVERIYQLSTMEGQPHFHCWIVPRGKEVAERGLKFLARDDSCEDEDAATLAEKLREVIN
jgi:diadenosine tetraphosphate (Ap4A) HIT family hydrolase